MRPEDFNAFIGTADTPVAHARRGPLAGATLAVKDIFDVENYPTGCGNPQKLAKAVPAAKTAPAVQALLAAGARFIGKTQTDEFAYSLTGHNSHYPQPVNPRAPARVTGGSSSGSAAAVSGRLADIATGTDTGGSIRVPAGHCGLIGLRTSHGRISLEGAMPLAPSFDTFGWFARNGALYDAVAQTLLGADDNDTTLSRPLRLQALEGLIDIEAMDAHSSSCRLIASVTSQPSLAGNISHELEDLYNCFRRLQAHEAWNCHKTWLTAGSRQISRGVRERFEFGAAISEETAIAETARRDSFRTELGDILGQDGYLVLPTVPGPAPLRVASFDDQQTYRARALHLLCIAGLTGFPQITLPLGEVDGAPFGISLLAPTGFDRALIALAREILKHAGRDN